MADGAGPVAIVDELSAARDPRRRRAFRMAARHYARQLREDWRTSVPALLAPGIGGTLSWFCPPLVIAAVIDRFEGGERPDLGALVPYLAAFTAVWLAGECVWRVGIHFLNRAAAHGAAQLQMRGMDALFDKDLAFFHDNFAGSLTKKVVGYGSSYEVLAGVLFFQVSASVLPIGFVAVVLWYYSPWLVLALVGMVTLTGLMVTPLILRRQKLVDAREAAHNDVAGHVADAITNIDAVRLFSREPQEGATHARNVERWRRLAVRSWDYQNRRIDLITAPLYVGTNLLGVVLAISLADEGRFSLAAVFVTFTYYTRFTGVVWEFNQIYRNVESQLSTAAQFTELLLDPALVNDPAEPAEPCFRHTGVAFHHVTFQYANRAEPLFRGLDLCIEPGQKVGLVGPSGGGKSTLTRLLLRFADIADGTIAIGGQDIACLRQADVRSQIAYVPQDPLMFHRSLRDNIAFGRLGASDDEIRAAAEAANATDFIEALPQGYDTLVGERGIKLSGGQRQRLAIARAVLRQAPILVLDEATSSLDSESEGLIQRALLTLMADRTAIVIAHRLSTVRAMDRLVVLAGGAVIEDGTHDTLLATNGTYATLWQKQSGGFLAA
ncbi:MAG TPA: ABC transporter ATP-binding protein [Acidimicrobiales bacterium]|jgi:ATP-binding cassette subfamily B protein|nr:ABC transporter ATP-binding protein [Acidimicrobiales bacterium]